MGKIIIGGGGISLDDVTATPADVLKGKTAYMMGGDDPAVGTMPNNGAWTGRIGVNGRTAIPTGYHNGSGYVDQSIPTMGAQTVTPGNSQKVVSCSGKYMTGNVTVPAVAGLTAANIKKGVVVGGVTGTFEGWVPTPQDLYYRGNNIVKFNATDSYGYVAFQTGRIYFSGRNDYGIITRVSGGTNIEVDLTGKSRIIIQGDYWNLPYTNIKVFLGSIEIGTVRSLTVGNSYTITIPINTAIAAKAWLNIRWSSNNSLNGDGVITRIRAE